MGYKFEFKIGQTVYIKLDNDQEEHFCTGITIREHGIIYLISGPIHEIPHYGFELSAERDELKKVK